MRQRQSTDSDPADRDDRPSPFSANSTAGNQLLLEPMSETEPFDTLALVRDLMFSSKIIATARAQGVNVRIVRDPSKLAAETGDRLLVDLNQDGAIPAATEWKARTGGAVIGFVSHVDAATIAKAREAGFDQVLARSRFVETLPDLLESKG
jgi:hypothetical protein